MLPREDKPGWADLPQELRARVENMLGSRVRRAQRIWGGYGPSVTLRLRLADGRRAFLKGAYPHVTAWMLAAMEREEHVYQDAAAWLGPWAPAFLGSLRYAEWHVLLLDDLGPTSVPPWTEQQARLAMRGYASFHASTLGQSLPDWLSRHDHLPFARRWAHLEPTERTALAALAGPRAAEAGEWLARHVPALDVAAYGIERISEPFALLHMDTRSDNLRLHGDRLYLFDWPFACIGPAEMDVAAFIQSVVGDGGPPAEVLLGWYQEVMLLRGEVLTACLAGVAGYFAANAWRPDLPGLPRLRWVQRQQLTASLTWAAARLGLQPPEWLAAIPTKLQPVSGEIAPAGDQTSMGNAAE